MEKLTLGKHDHHLTDLLKGVIFATIMLAPFFAVAVECLYMIVNKNAPTNYTGVQQDVFYNAIANLNTKAVFNWTNQTAMYTTIDNVCTNLEFGTGADTIALLLTFWIINTIIYVIFDIVIGIFKKITHLLQK